MLCIDLLVCVCVDLFSEYGRMLVLCMGVVLGGLANDFYEFFNGCVSLRWVVVSDFNVKV